MSVESLGVYLNDHLAGASAGAELAEKLSSDSEGTPRAAELAALAADIREDRATLEGMMERLGIGRSTVKQAAGWGLEKLSRLKLSERLTGGPELTRLLQLETLSIGIEGKLVMWRALREVAEDDGRLAGADLDRLIERARRQRQTLEPHRLDAAVRALSR